MIRYEYSFTQAIKSEQPPENLDVLIKLIPYVASIETLCRLLILLAEKLSHDEYDPTNYSWIQDLKNFVEPLFLEWIEIHRSDPSKLFDRSFFKGILTEKLNVTLGENKIDLKMGFKEALGGLGGSLDKGKQLQLFFVLMILKYQKIPNEIFDLFCCLGAIYGTFF